jgi:hypothetical protein
MVRLESPTINLNHSSVDSIRQAPLPSSRQAERFINFFLEHIDGLTVQDHSTVNKRINRLGIDMEGYLIKSNRPVSVAVDASVVKLNNEGG